MSFEIKRRIMASLVLALAIWPACHFFVVGTFGLNPWNWFGWAMYTQPSLRIEAVVHSLRGESVDPTVLGEGDYAAIQESFLRWSRRWVQVDDHDDPDDFAEAILRAHQDWDGVHLRLNHIALDRETAMIVIRETRKHTYFRESLGRR
jgi:hypothetical protein